MYNLDITIMGLIYSRPNKYCDLDQGEYYASTLELLTGLYSVHLPPTMVRKYMRRNVDRRKRALFAHILVRTMEGLRSGRLSINVCDYNVANCIAAHFDMSTSELLGQLVKEIQLQGDVFTKTKLCIKKSQNSVYLKMY